MACSRKLCELQAILLTNLVAVADATPMTEFAPFEVAAALTWTRQTADVHLSLAFDIVRRLPDVHAAMARGDLDLPKARVIRDAVSILEDETARSIVTAILPLAASLTTGQLRARLAKLVIEADPQAAARRHRARVAERRVVLQPSEDSCATLTGLDLPADSALAAANRLTAMAHAAKRAGDPRSVDQLRADTFLGLLLGDTSRCRGHVELVADLETLAGLASRPGHLHGYGPVIAEIARRVAEQQRHASWSFTITSPTGPGSTGPGPTGPGSTGPGPTGPGSTGPSPAAPGPTGPEPAGPSRTSPGSTGLDATGSSPAGPGSVGPGSAGASFAGSGSVGPASPGSVYTGPVRSRRAKARKPIRIRQRDGVAPGRSPTAANRSLADTSRASPVPRREADAASHEPDAAPGEGDAGSREPDAALREGDAVWREGDAGSREPDAALREGDAASRERGAGLRRFPGAALARHVRSRDRTCRAPGCRRSAWHADLDHTVAYEDGGLTEPGNLGPLCRYHHRAKHIGGWRLCQISPGVFVWRSPLGQRYEVRPEAP